MKRFLVTLAAFALLVLAAAPQHGMGQAEAYTDRQFEEVIRGYLLLGRERHAAAAAILSKVGIELNDPEILRDAAQSAIAARDLSLARRIGEAWLGAGGGVEALRLLARIHATTNGLDSAIGLLTRLAEESGPEEVYRTISDLKGDIAGAMRVSHPMHLRDSDFYSYLSILHLRAGNARVALSVAEEGLVEFPDSQRLLIVRLQLAELFQDDFGSISISGKIAEATNTDLVTAVMVYERWRQLGENGHFILPTQEDFEKAGEEFSDVARLDAGLFYLRHGDPNAALEVLATVPRNSPSRETAVAAQVRALRILDEGTKILELLDRELRDAPLESISMLSGLYADELDSMRGPKAAFDFLDGLDRASDDPDVLYRKSLYAEQLEMLDEAEDALRLYIKARPDKSDGYNALGYMFADHNIRLDEALSLIEHALQIEPNSAAIIDSHGWVYYRLGDLQKAKERLELSLRLMGNDPHVEVMAHYGEVLWELGQKDLAVRIWKEAWRIDSEDPYLKATLERYAIPAPQ